MSDPQDFSALAANVREHVEQTHAGNYVECSQSELYVLADAITKLQAQVAALVKERDRLREVLESIRHNLKRIRTESLVYPYGPERSWQTEKELISDIDAALAQPAQEIKNERK
jgi:urate oxidase